MITIDAIQHASPAVRAKSKQTWIRKITPTQFRVVPKSPSKSKRLVVFIPHDLILCVDAITGEICPANNWGVPCYHAFRAAEHLARSVKK